jgi:hypothetical protein
METAHDLDRRFGIHHSTIQIETGEKNAVSRPQTWCERQQRFSC